MTTEEMRERLLEFGTRVMALEKRLPLTFSMSHIGRQLIRSATSIGANYDEAQAAESKADFTHKLQIALKECRESHYWLTLLSAQQPNNLHLPENLLRECVELRAILSKAVATAKSRP